MESVLSSILLISGRPAANYAGPTPVFMVVFTIIAVALLVVGAYLSQRRRQWLQHSALTQGKIVEMTKRYARDDNAGRFPIYFPIVSFNVGEKEFRTEAEKGMSSSVQIGQPIEVRYNPENPYESALGTKNIPVPKPTIFFILGLVMMLSSIFLMQY
ncbi:Protein of unknown function [Pseudarcicella hirudinis]|uniref:DUF3592 domain-containing protein n=1 Tax=Pseudarcicella hirudinis TaxID=1079859 RepID=A0A1I5YKH8_9BACT|nr:DUF3592 domain-containing protein [Pseudarcicella hirudinis]SFQ44387.1 Protein of unknown function [Pseudarcicella hirudinis]